jgi:hypothetical protein
MDYDPPGLREVRYRNNFSSSIDPDTIHFVETYCPTAQADLVRLLVHERHRGSVQEIPVHSARFGQGFA